MTVVLASLLIGVFTAIGLYVWDVISCEHELGVFLEEDRKRLRRLGFLAHR